MGINWNAPHGTTPPHGIIPPQSSMYEVYRLTALIRDRYTIEELRKLCSDDDAVKNFLEMLAPNPDR